MFRNTVFYKDLQMEEIFIDYKGSLDLRDKFSAIKFGEHNNRHTKKSLNTRNLIATQNILLVKLTIDCCGVPR